jgi:hypothetical protein
MERLEMEMPKSPCCCSCFFIKKCFVMLCGMWNIVRMCSKQCLSMLCQAKVDRPLEERPGGRLGRRRSGVCGYGFAHESRACATIGRSEQGQWLCLPRVEGGMCCWPRNYIQGRVRCLEKCGLGFGSGRCIRGAMEWKSRLRDFPGL